MLAASSSNKAGLNYDCFRKVTNVRTTKNRKQQKNRNFSPCLQKKKLELHLIRSSVFSESFQRATLKSKKLFRLCAVLKSNSD